MTAQITRDAPLRERLQTATRGVHDRMHAHPGFAAVQNGTINLTRYAALLSRLYGFYLPFEAATGVAPLRTRWLTLDLHHLHVDAAAVADVARCQTLHRYQTPDHVTGALYVVEGSALGGRALARNLDGLLGAGTTAGRLFFQGHGADTGNAWRHFLDRLALVPTDATSQRSVISAAVMTFTAFEEWLNGWDTAHHDNR